MASGELTFPQSRMLHRVPEICSASALICFTVSGLRGKIPQSILANNKSKGCFRGLKSHWNQTVLDLRPNHYWTVYWMNHFVWKPVRDLKERIYWGPCCEIDRKNRGKLNFWYFIMEFTACRLQWQANSKILVYLSSFIKNIKKGKLCHNLLTVMLLS